MKNRGFNINRKRVARIMKEHHLRASPKAKKYHSYRGEVGVMSPNVVKRKFDVGRPYRVFGTDVTQFSISCGKLYLSPIIDFHTREIVAYDLSEHPNLNQIKRMMNKLEYEYGDELPGAILHSDQGWQYQQKWYQDKLEKLGMRPSMSRKGNCLDNSPTENFFGRLKEEMFYGHEWKYESLAELKRDIIAWIDYYNNERIVSYLKDSPIRYKAKLILMKA
jgi:transposase InsO family protein